MLPFVISIKAKWLYRLFFKRGILFLFIYDDLIAGIVSAKFYGVK